MKRCWAIVALSLWVAAGTGRAERDIAVTWWGCMSVEINFGDINLAFDPYVEPSEARFHYIFVSHDHYDHCHEPTLRKLIRPGAPFEMLFAARGCFYASRLDSPNNWSDTLLSDLAFVPREKATVMYPGYDDTVNPHIKRGLTFGGPTEIVTGHIRVEAFRSHEDPVPVECYRDRFVELRGPFPNLGFLVADLESKLTVAHTGDIWNAYPAMERMRGKVDILFYPLGKMSLAEKKKMMDYIRPRVAVPTHYRLPEPDFPIPPLYLESMTEEEAGKSENLRAACLGHWYPSPADPPAEIAAQRRAFDGLTRLVELKAGVRYVLPGDLKTFTGRDQTQPH